MSDKFISSSHIQKLGHNILEIRERALLNILSKLDSGLLFDNDLARSKELLEKLLKWFLFENCTQENLVLDLLKRILKSDSGRVLLQHYGPNAVISELKQIQTYINPVYNKQLEELLAILQIDKVPEPSIKVPPLQSEVPLSYRSNNSYDLKCSAQTVGTTASTITGRIQKEASLEQEVGVQIDSPFSTDESYSDKPTYRLQKTSLILNNINTGCLYVTLKWQPLIEADRNVLQSVEKGLKAPVHPSDLLHSCDFFNNVLLNDFPAEIFIQRPCIVLQFIYLIQTCASTRIVNSVLNCLQKLTKALQIRINHNNDPSMQNLKLEILPQVVSCCNSPFLDDQSENGDMGIVEPFESQEETLTLKNLEITLPDYCFQIIFHVLKSMRTRKESLSKSQNLFSQVGYIISLNLLDDLANLLSATFVTDIWELPQNSKTLKLLKGFNEIFVEFGDTLEYFRLESACSDSNSSCRAVYLYLLHNFLKILKEFVPFAKSSIILPVNCKNYLIDSLLDVTLSRLFPEVHQLIFKYVKSFRSNDDDNSLQKYDLCNRICKGLSATVRFIKEHKSLGFLETLKLCQTALDSLEFHKDLNFLDILLNICSQKCVMFSGEPEVLHIVEEIILKLLSHHLIDIKLETYRLCQNIVVDNIGPKFKLSPSIDNVGSEIYFLLNSKILTEITIFGINNENEEIHNYAEDILIHILKCKILVSEQIWNKVVEVLIPSLPVICCHSGKTPLGRSVMAIMDPDTSKELNLPDIVMIKCNIGFLFSKDSFLREEAFSRVSWLMANQPNSRDFLPKVNTLYDRALANACRLRRVVDVNKIRHTEHFYQPSSLNQVMDLLKSTDVEPVIRRSALNQVSVMLEDPLLHDIFLDLDGIETFIEMMKSALTEQNYENYPDSVIPIVSVFKNLCLYHSNVREELSGETDVLYFVLRGLYLFFTEERMREDAASLLFLLVFKDFISGTPTKANFSVAALICDKMGLPFVCNSYWSNSYYTGDDLKAIVSADRWCLSSIQIQWNSEIFGGFQELVKWDKQTYERKVENILMEDILKLCIYDLSSIKLSSLDFSLNRYLNKIQSGVSHSIVLEAMDKLSLYVNLYRAAAKMDPLYDEKLFLAHPWESSFSRFLKILPSCDEDLLLLRNVVKFLIELFPFYKKSEDCWISNTLKDHSLYILDIISVDANTSEETKMVGQELLNLIILCVSQEQHYLDFYISSSKPNESWSHVIKIIADNLKFGHTQHFYNLAYLDSLLSCLVHLTTTLGWSKTPSSSNAKEPLPQMIFGLCELVTAFHCGKGPTAAISVMGLSITRHVVLILNHLLSELLNSKAKAWESYFFGDLGEPNIIKSFFTLWGSRDVVLRAAALQLFSALAVSPKAACQMINELKIDNNSVWQLALAVVVDQREAGIVRENAAILLANLIGHTPPVCQNVAPPNGMSKKPFSVDIISYMEECDFFTNLDILLNNLYTLKLTETEKCVTYFKNSSIQYTNSSSSTDKENTTISTPGLVKGVCCFLYNLLGPNHEHLCARLHDLGLVKLIFRTLCNPSVSVSNTRELSLYCDLLEMNTNVILLLKKLASVNSQSVGVILHTRDCLNLLISLLNPKIYHTHLPQLMYLRNKLWTEIFNLIAAIIESCGENDKITQRSIDAVGIIIEIITELGTESFLETYCESLSYLGSHELQNAALISLIALLRIESHLICEVNQKKSFYTLQTILDTVCTPKTVAIIWNLKDNRENIDPKRTNSNNSQIKKSLKQFSNKYESNVLEEIYFGKIINKITPVDIEEDIEISFSENGSDGLKSGAEISKILLYLYDICDVKIPKDKSFNKKKTLIISALTTLLCVSREAKQFAFQRDLLGAIIKQLREYHIKLSLESVEYLRRVQDKKRLCPVLAEINDLIGLLTNFMLNDDDVKVGAVNLNLADILHKLWVWFAFQNAYMVNVLRLLCIFTSCKLACQSMPFTSSVAGSGPRKTPSNVSLLHAVILLITKEMDQLSKTHNLNLLEFSLAILSNCCDLLECRVLISKSNLLQSVSRLHPSITKRQKSWENVELLWLDFLQIYTQHPEGQTAVAKDNEVLDLIMSLCLASKPVNREAALDVLRNISFYQPNRFKLLSSGDFLNILQVKLTNGTNEEKNTAVIIIWAMAANNQKAKIIFKSAQIDVKLQDALKQYQILMNEPQNGLKEEEILRMHEVLKLLRSDKS